jgi:hypothetical protein
MDLDQTGGGTEMDQRRNGIEKDRKCGEHGDERIKRKWSRMSTDQKAPGRKDKKKSRQTVRKGVKHVKANV